MEYKSNLTLAERVVFVDRVIATSTIDDVYEPALYDFAFRINAFIFFASTDVSGWNNDQLMVAAYSDDMDTLLYGDKQRKAILTGLDKACKEKIHYLREEYMVRYQNDLAPEDPFDRLVDLIREIWDGVKPMLDPEAIVNTVLNERAKLDAAGTDENAISFPIVKTNEDSLDTTLGEESVDIANDASAPVDGDSGE